MATTTSKSLQTTATTFAFLFAFLAITIISCKQGNEGKGEWIPTPPDTSALGKIDHFIPRGQMDEFIKAYEGQRDTIMNKVPGLFMPASEAFNKEWLLKVLKDSACVGIRIYYGVRADTKQGNEFRLMIVGVDEQGKDLYISKGSQLAGQAGDEGKGGLEWGQCNPPCTPQLP
jgi:hypothetical protein